MKQQKKKNNAVAAGALQLLRKLDFKIVTGDYNGLVFEHELYPIKIIYLYFTHTVEIEYTNYEFTDVPTTHYFGEYSQTFYDILRHLLAEINKRN